MTRLTRVVSLFLTLWGSLCLSFVVHEVGHGIAGQIAGGSFDGISVRGPSLSGNAWISYPLIEFAESADRWSFTGGPLLSIVLGILALAWSRRCKHIIPVSVVLSTIGAICGALLLGIVHRGQPVDFYVLSGFVGLEAPEAGWIALALGALGSTMVLWWYVRRMREIWSEKTGIGFLFDAVTPILLLLVLWETNSWPLWGLIVGLCVTAFTITLRWSPQLGSSIFGSATWLIGSVALLAAAAWILSPEPPSARRIEKWIARSPDDPAVLRTAAFYLYKTGHDERATEIRERALQLAPQSPGARYDWALTTVADGDRLAQHGDQAGAITKWTEALATFQAASEDLRGNAAVLAQIAGVVDPGNGYPALGKSLHPSPSQPRPLAPAP